MSARGIGGARHTPGPYFVEHETVYALQDSDPPYYRGGKLLQENRFYAHVQHRRGVDTEERAATARLIAAAPELYDLLREVAEELASEPERHFRLLNQIGGALAKAEGRQP